MSKKASEPPRRELEPVVVDQVRQFIEGAIPFNEVLGISVTSVERGRARLELPFREELVGDVLRPSIHGGVISALIDVAGGAAVATRICPGDRMSTVDLRVDYLRPAGKAPLVAESEVIRTGNRVAVVRVLVLGSDPAVEVAQGVCVYNINRLESKE